MKKNSFSLNFFVMKFNYKQFKHYISNYAEIKHFERLFWTTQVEFTSKTAIKKEKNSNRF